MSEQTAMAYAGVCRQCGGVMMLTVDTPEHAEVAASAAIECLENGYIVERMTVEAARERASQWCKCPKPDTESEIGYVSEYDVAMSPAWRNGAMSDGEMICYLRSEGYTVIDYKSTGAFRYAAQPCPLCGHESEARR